MPDYNNQDLKRMQQDAIDRVRMMQKIAKQRLQESDNSEKGNQIAKQEIKNHKEEKTKEPPRIENKKREENKILYNNYNRKDSESSGDFIATLTKKILPNMEGDRILILFLIFMLQKEEVDVSLILALLYMAL